MKVKIILFCLGILLSLNSVAQIAVGAKAGINFNSFIGKRAYDVIPGFNVGGFAKYPVLSFLNARTELLYFQQGANLIDYLVIPPDIQHNNAKVIFHSIQVPLMVELGLPALKDETLQPKLLLGAYYTYSVLIRERYVNMVRVGGYPTVEYSGRTNVSNDFYRNQYGLIGGLAAEMKVLSYPVSLEFRYHYSLKQANRPDSSSKYYIENTTDLWGDNLRLGTLSLNVAVTLTHF